jgi:hypothetical protein
MIASEVYVNRVKGGTVCVKELAYVEAVLRSFVERGGRPDEQNGRASSNEVLRKFLSELFFLTERRCAVA